MKMVENWPPSRDDEEMMMRSPDEWPRWPVLPLVQRGTGKIGYLAEIQIDDPIKPTVWLGNVFDTDALGLAPIEYESFLELLDAGWRVD